MRIAIGTDHRGIKQKEFVKKVLTEAGHSVEDFGYHLLASEKPIAVPNVDLMLKRMPQGAQQDLMEWFPERNIRGVLSDILGREVSLSKVTDSERPLSLTDDRPYNEYYVLRRVSAIYKGTFKSIF